MKDFKSPSLLPLLFCFLSLCKKRKKKRTTKKKEKTKPKPLLSTLLSKEIIPDTKTSLEDQEVQKMKQAKNTSKASPEEPQTVMEALNNDNICHHLATKSTIYLCLALHYCSTAASNCAQALNSSLARNMDLFLQQIIKSRNCYCSTNRNQRKLLETSPNQNI